MRSRTGAIAFAALLALTACVPDEQPPPGLVEAPAFSGRWVVVNYWAIWCAPCREEIPELNTLSRRGLVDVYAINFDDVQGQALLDQAAELDIQFPMLTTDPAPALGIARPTVLPTTLILSPEGALVTRLIGPQTAASLESEIAGARNRNIEE